MKIKEGFLLRRVADTWVVMPVDQGILSFDGMLTLNETGVTLWRKLEAGADLETLAAAITEEYDTKLETARADAKAFCDYLTQIGCLEQ